MIFILIFQTYFDLFKKASTVLIKLVCTIDNLITKYINWLVNKLVKTFIIYIFEITKIIILKIEIKIKLFIKPIYNNFTKIDINFK